MDAITEVRRRTVSFRLTETERQTVDALARRSGLEPSEFARQAMFDAATLAVRARELAREEARAEVASELTTAHAELDRVKHLYASWRSRATSLEEAASQLAVTRSRVDELRGIATRWQAKAESLEMELGRASEDLLDAIGSLMGGAPDGRARVARLWGTIRAYPYPDRRTLLPILAAVVADSIEAMVIQFPTNADAFARWPTVKARIEWLFDGLRLDAGQETGYSGGSPDAAWKPVVAALARADEERRRQEPDFLDT